MLFGQGLIFYYAQVCFYYWINITFDLIQ